MTVIMNLPVDAPRIIVASPATDRPLPERPAFLGRSAAVGNYVSTADPLPPLTHLAGALDEGVPAHFQGEGISLRCFAWAAALSVLMWTGIVFAARAVIEVAW